MSIFDNLYINQYKTLSKEIEKIDTENLKGYNSFFEYVLANQKMIKYFEELKNLERKCDKIHLESYESFKYNILKKLKDVYDNMIHKIFEIEDHKSRYDKLLQFKDEIQKCFGYNVDEAITNILNDISEKIDNIDKYFIEKPEYLEVNLFKNIDDLNNYTMNETIEDDEYTSDPFLQNAIDVVIETGQASTSFIQRMFRVGYARAGRIIDQMEERGIISGYQGSKPRQVLMSKERWEKLKQSNDKSENLTQVNNDKTLIKLTDKESNKYREYKHLDSIAILSDIMKKYGIEVEYGKTLNGTKNIPNCLITECMADNAKTDFINNILKYYFPDQLKIAIADSDNSSLYIYNGIPHLLIPVVSDIKKIIGLLAWLAQETKSRLNLFLQEKTKNIDEYNKKVNNNKLPQILVIISEIYNILNDESKELILNTLINSERTGIKFIIYSKFSRKNLNIGPIEDLLKIYSQYNPNITLLGNTNKLSELQRIDEGMDGFDFEKYVC